MGRSKTYWIMAIVGAISAVSGIVMMRSDQFSLHTPGKVLGWIGIGVIVIARIFFARRPQPPPPKPKS
ncbi:MAG TPA: hypothetical protein VI685_14430 [Candidatus Angelobacter sp.]